MSWDDPPMEYIEGPDEDSGPCGCEDDTGYVCERHGYAPDEDLCFHCRVPVWDSRGHETTHTLYCSSLCATLVERYEHSEDCRCFEFVQEWMTLKGATHGFTPPDRETSHGYE